MLMNEQKKLTKNHYRIFGLSWAGWVFDFYDLVLFTFLMSEIQSSLNISAEMISLCLGVSLFATGFGGILFGALGDKFGRKKVLQWTIIVYSIGTFLSAFSWSFYSNSNYCSCLHLFIPFNFLKKIYIFTFPIFLRLNYQYTYQNCCLHLISSLFLQHSQCILNILNCFLLFLLKSHL